MARTGMFATLAALALASVAEAQMMAPPMYYSDSSVSSTRTGIFGRFRARRAQRYTTVTPGAYYTQPVAGTAYYGGTGAAIYGTPGTGIYGAPAITPPISGTPIGMGSIYTPGTTPIVYGTPGITTPYVYGTPGMTTPYYGTLGTGAFAYRNGTTPYIYGTPWTTTGGTIIGTPGTTTPMVAGYTPTIPTTYAGTMPTYPTWQPATTAGYTTTYRGRLFRRGTTTTPYAGGYATPFSTPPGGIYYR
jgi:hypothetical protein